MYLSQQSCLRSRLRLRGCSNSLFDLITSFRLNKAARLFDVRSLLLHSVLFSGWALNLPEVSHAYVVLCGKHSYCACTWHAQYLTDPIVHTNLQLVLIQTFCSVVTGTFDVHV